MDSSRTAVMVMLVQEDENLRREGKGRLLIRLYVRCVCV